MIRIRLAEPQDRARAFDIWREAVRATHGFLSPEDFEQIGQLVAGQYLPNAELWLAVEPEDRPVAFMGLSGAHLDALFVDPARHGRGIGRALVRHALSLAPQLTVDVNEQNASGVGFYERLGFRRIGRSALDGDGRPYPLLHLEWAGDLA